MYDSYRLGSIYKFSAYKLIEDTKNSKEMGSIV